MTENQKTRCLVSAIVALSFLAIAVVAVGWPWLSKNAYYNGTANDAAERIGRYQRLIKQKPAFEGALKKLQLEQKKQGYFLDSPDPELAAAEMQKRVKDAVNAAGGTLVSTQNMESKKGQILVRVRMKGDADALAGVLHDLESSHPLMFVDNMNIRSRRTVKGRRKNRVTTYSLDVNFDLISYMLGGG